MSDTSPIFLSSVPITSVPVNLVARNWSGFGWAICCGIPPDKAEPPVGVPCASAAPIIAPVSAVERMSFLSIASASFSDFLKNIGAANARLTPWSNASPRGDVPGTGKGTAFFPAGSHGQRFLNANNAECGFCRSLPGGSKDNIPELARRAMCLRFVPGADAGLRGPIWSFTEMSDRSADIAAGGPHIPVLLDAVLAHLAPRSGEIYIDGTFGAGGYTRAILNTAGCNVIGIDRDQTAIAQGAGLVSQSGGRLTLTQDRFSELDSVARELGHEAVDGVVLDIGVSSMQLDRAERGFSFRLDGPLDMRMDRGGPSAADVIARASERDLANIIFILGEERHSRAVARAIVAERQKATIATTRALADIVSRVVRSKPGQIHPATRTFQALRIF